jgi:hypothetical protein
MVWFMRGSSSMRVENQCARLALADIAPEQGLRQFSPCLPLA